MLFTKRCSEVTSKGEHNEKKKKQKIIQKPDWDSNKMENIFNPHLQVHQEEKHVWLSPEMHINSELIQILPW